MAMLCHLLGMLIIVVGPLGFLGPMIVWLVKKDDHPFIDEQGKESLNFQITVLLASIVAFLLIFACVGAVLLPAVLVANIVFCIIGTIKANNGEHFRYPLSLRLIK